MSTFSFLKKGLTDFAASTKKKTDELAKKKTDLASLKSLPLPREDLISGVCSMLDAQAKRYPESLAQTLDAVISNPQFDFKNSQLDLISNSGNFAQPGTLPRQNALYFFGDIIKEKISSAIEAMPYPAKVGLPLSKRQPLIKKLETEITQLENDISDLQAQAADLNITLPAPLTEREKKIAETDKIARLVQATPFPDHTIRQMLSDGLDPLREMEKIKTPRAVAE